MDEQTFEANVESLGSALMAAIEGFFAERGMPFSRSSFLNQSRPDFDQVARDAHFFGADCFPNLAEKTA